MNENLQDLKEKAKRLSLAENRNWDALIAVFTQIIDLEQEPDAKALQYLTRGAAYNYRGDHDLAIADIDEALKLAPSDPLMKFPLMKFMGLFYHGVACRDKGDYDQAIADFDEALGLDLPDTATQAIGLFFHRGVAYGEKGDHEQAMVNFAKALELNPKDAKAYLFRGFAYIDQENFLDAFTDFVKADECDPILKGKVPEIYVALQIATIYKDRDEKDRDKAFVLYLSLLYAIIEIRERQFDSPGEDKEVAHYTSLHTLRKLASAGRFRLYNAAYMNDPEEGRVFFEIMKGHGIENVEEAFYGNDEKKTQLSPAYIGSFVKVDASEPEQKDELFLWRTYGKHDEQEAAGSCLIFKHEGTVFAKKYKHGAQIGAMQQLQFQLQSKLPVSADDISNPGERQPQKPELYEIVYRNKGGKQKLSEELKELAESLKQIKGHIEEEKDNDNKEKLRKLVRNLLDAIRFLFKSRHYNEEKEVRVVQVRYYDETETPQKPTDIQVDTEQIPPRFYLETHENFCFSEVILGPRARGEFEWKRWLKKQDKTLIVKKSEIKYGERYH